MKIFCSNNTLGSNNNLNLFFKTFSNLNYKHSIYLLIYKLDFLYNFLKKY
jgi:hypothetical protein